MTMQKSMSKASNPLVTVVIPVFNGVKWLNTALSSALNNSDVRLEVIVIDDGSTDGTTNFLLENYSDNANVILLHNDSNKGIVATLNRGLDAARGRYIARLDADDICMPNRFSQQLLFLEETGCHLCGSWFIEFGQGVPRTVRWPHEEDAVRAGMLFQSPICHPTFFAKREVFEHFSYRPEYKLAEDYDLLVRASSKFRLANIPAALLKYRRHSGQETQSKQLQRVEVTRKIRSAALWSQGVEPDTKEEYFHHLIRAPLSIHDADELAGIEQWLLKLYKSQHSDSARQIVASQWIRACIRAAPLRKSMWKLFFKSPLRKFAGQSKSTDIDIYLLSKLGLDYRSQTFKLLQRTGLSG